MLILDLGLFRAAVSSAEGSDVETGGKVKVKLSL
jgi:hypothetical protein